MATIGLDKLYYAKITEDENGDETYATPKLLAKAISADLSVELNEATLYADDGVAELVKEFKGGTLSLGIDDIGAWHIQRFGKLIQINKHGATRFEIAAGSRLTRSNIAQDKNGKHLALPNANGSYYRANKWDEIKIQPNSKSVRAKANSKIATLS